MGIRPARPMPGQYLGRWPGMPLLTEYHCLIAKKQTENTRPKVGSTLNHRVSPQAKGQRFVLRRQTKHTVNMGRRHTVDSMPAHRLDAGSTLNQHRSNTPRPPGQSRCMQSALERDHETHYAQSNRIKYIIELFKIDELLE